MLSFLYIHLLFSKPLPHNQKKIIILGTALSLSSVTVLYSEGLLFLLTPLVLYLFFNLLSNSFRSVLAPLAKIFTTVVLLNPITLLYAFRLNIMTIVKSVSQASFGFDYLALSSPLDISGLYNLIYSRNLNIVWDFILACPIIILWFIGLKRINNRLLWICFILPPLFLYFGLGIQGQQFPHIKNTTICLFIPSVLLALGLEKLVLLKRSKITKTIILLMIFALTLRSAFRSLYQLYWHPLVVDKSLISLVNLNQNQSITQPFMTADVFVGEKNLWKRLWREYFLSDKNIITRQNFCTEKAQDRNSISLVLSEKNNTEEQRLIKYNIIIWENDYYQLGHIKPIPFDAELLCL